MNSRKQLFEALDLEKGDDVESYFKRYTLFCRVQKVADDMKCPLLLGSIGGAAYTKIEALVAPRDILVCTYDQISQALIEYYKPKTLVVMEKHKFRSRTQAEGETFNEFLTDLKKLSKECGFRDNNRLE